MRPIFLILLFIVLPARAQLPLLINETDNTIFFPAGAIGGTLSASNVAVVQALTIGGQTSTNLVGTGLTNNAGTLQATSTGGGGGGGTVVTVDGATVPSPLDITDAAGISATWTASPSKVAFALVDGDRGDISITGGFAMTIDDGALTLNELSDVAITTPAAGQVLIHNGTAWLNSAANPFQATNANLTTVANLTGGTSSNFLAGDGTFKQVNTNAIPGLVGDIAKLATIASPSLTGNPLSVTPAADDNDTSIATTAYVQTELAAYPTDTVAFQNKTFDAAATGNVLKQTKHLYLVRPDYSDGAGAVPQTNNYVASGLMHYSLSGNAETNVNWVVYETIVPPDIDTAVEMTATFQFLGNGSDTDAVVFHLTYGQGVAGSAFPPAITTSPIVMTVTPTSPGSGVLQISSAFTLTGWASALNPGRPLSIKVARLQNTADDSARDVLLDIAYGSTQ